MLITRGQLRQIIKEEASRLVENPPVPGTGKRKRYNPEGGPWRGRTHSGSGKTGTGRKAPKGSTVRDMKARAEKDKQDNGDILLDESDGRMEMLSHEVRAEYPRAFATFRRDSGRYPENADFWLENGSLVGQPDIGRALTWNDADQAWDYA